MLGLTASILHRHRPVACAWPVKVRDCCNALGGRSITAVSHIGRPSTGNRSVAVEYAGSQAKHNAYALCKDGLEAALLGVASSSLCLTKLSISAGLLTAAVSRTPCKTMFLLRTRWLRNLTLSLSEARS